MASGATLLQRGVIGQTLDARGGAATGDVIHTAFIHDFTDFAAAVETDRRAIETARSGPWKAQADRWSSLPGSSSGSGGRQPSRTSTAARSVRQRALDV
jgi:hypothetical protein